MSKLLLFLFLLLPLHGYTQDQDPVLAKVCSRWNAYMATLKTYRCDYQVQGFTLAQGKRTEVRTEGQVVQSFPKLKVVWEQWFDSARYSEKIQFVNDGNTFQASDYSGNVIVARDVANCLMRPDIENPLFLPFSFLYFEKGGNFQSNELFSFKDLSAFKDIKIKSDGASIEISMNGKIPKSDELMGITVSLDQTSLLPSEITLKSAVGNASKVIIDKWDVNEGRVYPVSICRQEYTPAGELVNEMRYSIKSVEFDPSVDVADFRIPVELARQIIDADRNITIKPEN